MMWMQEERLLKPKARGFRLIRDELPCELPVLRGLRAGMMNVFALHTSASSANNESADRVSAHAAHGLWRQHA